MTPPRTPLLAVTALAATLILATTGVATAVPPKHSTASFTVTEPEENFPCQEQGFTTLATFTVTRRSTEFSNASGDPTREIRHVRFSGTLYSPDLSRSIPYGGTFTRTEDYRTGLVTITGLFRSTPGPGPGPSAAGRSVIDVESDAALFEAGRLPIDYEQEVCRSLAG